MSILDEADTLINGERAKTYGSPTPLYERTAGMWAAYLGADVTAANVIDMMILLKVARAQPGYHRDSYVDTAGYAAIAERLHDENEPGGQTPVNRVRQQLGHLRVWQFVKDIPTGVSFIDKDGDAWVSEEWRKASDYDGYLDSFAPFTEVLDG